MKILCDTCSILMVIRIAPDMLNDEKYGCFTIQEVRKEIIRQQKFKDKYPWRHKLKDKIRCIPNSDILNNNTVNQYFEAINLLIESNITNNKTGRLFDLSPVDKKFIACALSFGFKISTGDGDIKDIANQEFSKAFKGNISPLGMVNMWIRNGLINWNDTLNEYVTDWKRTGEAPQPKHQKRVYRKLAGLKYPGS
jgi:hypothetical protein